MSQLSVKFNIRRSGHQVAIDKLTKMDEEKRRVFGFFSVVEENGKLYYYENNEKVMKGAVQVGEDMGYLPGDIDEKYMPFMGPLTDNLENIARINYKGGSGSQKKAMIQNQVNELMNHIEVCPIAFLRGRSFEDAIVIVDEAQNLDLTALKTVLTRVGKYCKIILLGSMNQIDDWRQRKQPICDFEKVMNKLCPQPYVGSVNLVESMRSPICVEVDNLLGEIDREEKISVTFDDGHNSGIMYLNK